MERCDYKSMKHNQYRNSSSSSTTTSKDHPSFSSTLLDSIYLSIDENNNTMKTKQINNKDTHNSHGIMSYASYSKEEDLANYKRACLIEKWMDKKKLASGEKRTIARQKSMAEFHRDTKASTMMNLSSSSNSDSSFSGGLSPSETEYSVPAGVYSRSENFNLQKPKPIRTSLQSEKARNQYIHNNKYISSNSYGLHDREVENLQRQKIKHESYDNDNNNAVTKTKKLTRALKIYHDLKKAKQPISPGGRLASFLNSLFTNGNSKKQTNNTNSTQFQTDLQNTTISKSPYSSNCSSASSFSRSCLSKTPKVISGEKRSVRFYPVSVIVDEDCRPVGHKSLHEEQHFAEQTSRDVMKNYHNNNGDFDMKFVTVASDDDDNDDDDDVSCASSDLFELDNLASIGIDNYREELPVYETTRFDMNRVISKGLVV